MSGNSHQRTVANTEKRRIAKQVSEFMAQYLTSAPPKDTPWYESGLFWGCISLAAAIILAVLAAKLRDFRSLLIVAWALAGISWWVACRRLRSRKLYWIALSLLVVGTGAGLLKLHRVLTPMPVSEALSLKGLFNSDFGGHLSKSNLGDTTVTIGSKSGKFPEETLHFTPQLYLDLSEGTQFLGFYLPVQDKDPEQASFKSVRLCRMLPSKFPELLQKLHGIEEIEPNSRGSTLKSTELPLSRRVYIYHEDFISPQDLGELVKEYEARQLQPEFRGSEYLTRMEAERALRK